MIARKRSKAKTSDETFVEKLVETSALAVQTSNPLENSEVTFPIVGIGASAGGLAAFEAFFSGMPADTETGMAFVLVQHLAPDHKSILTDLIQRSTRMQVFEVEDGMIVKPNCVYIIPPNRDMAFLNGTLQLMEPNAPRGLRLPIDFFFRSLAQDQHERAICIVLSGTGSDGTLGARAIKGEGGMVMAQTPESTEYDGMPRSVINTGLVDYQLLPAEMPTQLIFYMAHAFKRHPWPVTAPILGSENALKKIFVLLRSQTGHDFSQYKPNTIGRRIERRMAVHQIEGVEAYIQFLQRTPAEVEALFRDLLIGVTSFFRDPEAFKALEEQVIPKLFAGKPAGDVIRIWVPGCSTGEEAYTIAILLQEHMDTLKLNYRVQVFATDIDSQAIAIARAGLYPASIAADVLPSRLAQFFTLASASESGGTDSSSGSDPSASDAYRIHKNIRDLLIFSEHNVIKDPPFSKLDLISCRNILIYLGGDLQKKIIPLFHYALNPNGFLFLGTSETVGEFLDLFLALDPRLKLYQRKDDIYSVHRSALSRYLSPPTVKGVTLSLAARKMDDTGTQTFRGPMRELTEQALLQQVALAGALVNAQGDILYLHGRTGLYLEPTPGEAGINNILKMAREGLQRTLTTALHKAALTKEVVRHPGLRVKTNGDFTIVNLIIRPVPTGSASGFATTTVELLFLIIFEEVPAVIPTRSEPTTGEEMGDPMLFVGSTPSIDTHIATLEKELRTKEEYLQVANEELETSNEELKSSNEELQSLNEELQSTNEELETSKEELQSVNEELSTVNAELQAKVANLSRVNNDMNNLLAGSGIATIFVDYQLRILRFTPSATRIINLIPSDVGRPVSHIVSNLRGHDHLVSDAQAVLDNLIPKESEVQSQMGAWYTMRIQPYRTLDNVIEGVVITFFDITEMKQTQAALRKAESPHRLAVVVRDAYDAITMHDLSGCILAWNPAAERKYGWTETEALTMNIRELIPESQREAYLAVMQQLIQAKVLTPYRTQRITKDGRIVEIWLTATALLNQTGEIYAITTTEREANPNV